jgi:hypothetical protein
MASNKRESISYSPYDLLYLITIPLFRILASKAQGDFHKRRLSGNSSIVLFS